MAILAALGLWQNMQVLGSGKIGILKEFGYGNMGMRRVVARLAGSKSLKVAKLAGSKTKTGLLQDWQSPRLGLLQDWQTTNACSFGL